MMKFTVLALAQFTFLSSTQAVILSSPYQGFVTSVGSEGALLGISLNDVVSGQFSYDVDAAEVEFFETFGSVVAGIWAAGAFGPSGGNFDASTLVNIGSFTWHIDFTQPITVAPGIVSFVNVNNGDGNQNVGSTPSVLGDEAIFTVGSSAPTTFPGYQNNTDAYIGITLQDTTAPFDFITAPEEAPGVLTSDVTGSGVVAMYSDTLGTIPLFTFDISSFEPIPEPTSGLLLAISSLLLGSYRNRKRT